MAVPQYTKPQQQPRQQLQYKPGPRFEAHRTPGAGQICCKYFYNVPNYFYPNIFKKSFSAQVPGILVLRNKYFQAGS